MGNPFKASGRVRLSFSPSFVSNEQMAKLLPSKEWSLDIIVSTCAFKLDVTPLRAVSDGFICDFEVTTTQAYSPTDYSALIFEIVVTVRDDARGIVYDDVIGTGWKFFPLAGGSIPMYAGDVKGWDCEVEQWRIVANLQLENVRFDGKVTEEALDALSDAPSRASYPVLRYVDLARNSKYSTLQDAQASQLIYDAINQRPRYSVPTLANAGGFQGTITPFFGLPTSIFVLTPTQFEVEKAYANAGLRERWVRDLREYLYVAARSITPIFVGAFPHLFGADEVGDFRHFCAAVDHVFQDVFRTAAQALEKPIKIDDEFVITWQVWILCCANALCVPSWLCVYRTDGLPGFSNGHFDGSQTQVGNSYDDIYQTGGGDCEDFAQKAITLYKDLVGFVEEGSCRDPFAVAMYVALSHYVLANAHVLSNGFPNGMDVGSLPIDLKRRKRPPICHSIDVLIPREYFHLILSEPHAAGSYGKRRVVGKLPAKIIEQLGVLQIDGVVRMLPTTFAPGCGWGTETMRQRWEEYVDLEKQFECSGDSDEDDELVTVHPLSLFAPLAWSGSREEASEKFTITERNQLIFCIRPLDGYCGWNGMECHDLVVLWRDDSRLRTFTPTSKFFGLDPECQLAPHFAFTKRADKHLRLLGESVYEQLSMPRTIQPDAQSKLMECLENISHESDSTSTSAYSIFVSGGRATRKMRQVLDKLLERTKARVWIQTLTSRQDAFSLVEIVLQPR